MEGYPGWILGSAFKIFFMWVGLVWRFYVFVWSPNNIDCSCAFLPSSPGPSQSLRHFALLCFVVGLGPRWCANLRIPRASCVDVQIIQESGQKGARENPWKSVKCQRKKGKCQWKNVKIRDNSIDRFEQTLNPELLHNLCFQQVALSFTGFSRFLPWRA